MAPLGISRHGLTRCPGCKGHVKLAEAGDPPVCPFCATPLNGDTAMSGLMRLASSSRSALIAGALFASPGLVACGDDSSDTTDVGSSISDTAGDTAGDTAIDVFEPDATAQPLYGAPAPDTMEDTSPPPPDDATRAAYGMPPQEDVMPPEPDASADAQDAAPDDVMRALYGMPPEMPDADAGPEADAEADASDASDASDAEDTGPMPQPVYGAPPPMDAGSTDASDASDS